MENPDLNTLSNITSATVKLVNKPKTYAAIVKALEYCVTDYEHNAYDPEWDNWYLRDVVEQGCLLILGQMVDQFGVEGLVKSRFVPRWLAKEPWGGVTDEQRQTKFIGSLSKQQRLQALTTSLCDDAAGRAQLVEAKLLPAVVVHHRAANDTRMMDGESTAGEEEGQGPVIRRRDQSSAGENIRRRHREAMVLNDGTRPLGRGDIIERDR